MGQSQKLKMSADRDNPGVIAKGPAIYLVAVGLGFVLRFVHPLPIATYAMRFWSGLVLAVAGFLLVFFSIREFRKRRTSENTDLATTTIVTSGFYRFTRNPMYVGLTLMLLGIGLAANDWWTLLMLVPVMVILHVGVIFREERYLEQKFGQVYLDYKTSVRRWF